MFEFSSILLIDYKTHGKWVSNECCIWHMTHLFVVCQIDLTIIVMIRKLNTKTVGCSRFQNYNHSFFIIWSLQTSFLHAKVVQCTLSGDCPMHRMELKTQAIWIKSKSNN